MADWADVAADAAMNVRLERIQAACGALCDTSRPAIDHGERFKHSSAPMPCSWLLADGTGIDATLEQRWAPDQLPARWRDEFTMHGRLGLIGEYHNSSIEAQAGGSVGTPRNSKQSRPTNGWARARIDGLVRQARGQVPPPPGRPAGCTNTSLGWSFWTRYHNLNRELWVGLHAANTEDANVLVIGSQSPWVEALALGAGATHVYTLEYGKIVTDHPNVTTLLPEEFLSRARAGALPRFDVVLTASSVEHSGLGRYNDGLNPWGDILAIARAWCVSGPHARLVIAVPTSVSPSGREAFTPADAAKYKQDHIQFNGQRTYGPVRYPYLVTNWRFSQRIYNGNVPGWAQTVYVFRKVGHGRRQHDVMPSRPRADDAIRSSPSS